MRSKQIWAFILTVGIATGIFFWANRQGLGETPPWRAAELSQPTAVPPLNPAVVAPAGKIPFTFITYNLRNWLVSDQSPAKSDLSKNAIVKMLIEAAPDVIGICEIGSETDLREVQLKLKDKGLDLPFSHHTGGSDGIRHLGLLSRFPIQSVNFPELKISGKGISMRRGILDATLLIGGNEVRFLGLHLKSKRSIQDYDEGIMRLEEAIHARKHIDRILAENPATLLVTYGDFNDGPGSVSTRAILGTYRAPAYMTALRVKDSRGETWTHCYEKLDSYTRIDFVTVSKFLKPHVDKLGSRILDDAQWEDGSDHRPVLIHFK